MSLYDSISTTDYTLNINVNPLAPKFITDPPLSKTLVLGGSNDYIWPEIINGALPITITVSPP